MEASSLRLSAPLRRGWHTLRRPELPDVTVYVERLEAKLRGATLQRARLLDAFVLRTALPPLDVAAGRAVVAVVPGGRLLADRALWRLLKASWPSSIDELG